jgi:RNA-directed DNA polymerase
MCSPCPGQTRRSAPTRHVAGTQVSLSFAKASKYFRYMDDMLILAPTRCKLKKAIRVLNETFNELKLEKHPDKTSMGPIEKGFDFLGYHFSPEGLTLARKTIDNFVEKALRLYEQEPPHLRMKRLGEYCHKWVGWSRTQYTPFDCH